MNTILIPEFKIQKRVREIASEISQKHIDSGNPYPPVLICILNGAFMFFSDIIKNTDIDVEVDFIRVKSYHGKDNTGGVTILKNFENDLTGKNVFIIEDIVDTGNTMQEIMLSLAGESPHDIYLVTLLRRKDSEHPVDFNAFEINDEFVFGYGLDDNGLKRNYRNIYY